MSDNKEDSTEKPEQVPTFAPGIDPRLCSAIVHEICIKGTPKAAMATMRVGFLGKVTDVEKFRALKTIVVKLDIQSTDPGIHLVMGDGPILEVAKLHDLPFVNRIELGRKVEPL